MRIYSVYENKVHELEVEIVSDQNLRAIDRLERLPAFRFDIVFVKGDYPETEKKAIEIALKEIGEKISKAVAKVDSLEDKREKLLELQYNVKFYKESR